MISRVQSLSCKSNDDEPVACPGPTFHLKMRTTCPLSDLRLRFISSPATSFDHGHDVLLLLRHHWDGARLAVLADVPLSVKQEGRCEAESDVCGAATSRRERRDKREDAEYESNAT